MQAALDSSSPDQVPEDQGVGAAGLASSAESLGSPPVEEVEVLLDSAGQLRWSRAHCAPVAHELGCGRPLSHQPLNLAAALVLSLPGGFARANRLEALVHEGRGEQRGHELVPGGVTIPGVPHPGARHGVDGVAVGPTVVRAGAHHGCVAATHRQVIVCLDLARGQSLDNHAVEFHGLARWLRGGRDENGGRQRVRSGVPGGVRAQLRGDAAAMWHTRRPAAAPPVDATATFPL